MTAQPSPAVLAYQKHRALHRRVIAELVIGQARHAYHATKGWRRGSA